MDKGYGSMPTHYKFNWDKFLSEKFELVWYIFCAYVTFTLKQNISEFVIVNYIPLGLPMWCSYMH